MDRIVRRIIVASLALLAVFSAAGQPPAGSPAPPASDVPPRYEPPHPGNEGRPGRRDRDEKSRRLFEKLPPEQRDKLRENMRRWEKLPPEERQDLRDEAKRRRARMAREIDELIQKSGLTLTSDQREVFALRYAQERRRIEETLRKEMESRRRPMLDEMNERLKKEFASGAPAASPAASPSPQP